MTMMGSERTRVKADPVVTTSRRSPRRCADDGGAVLVEAALITPLFMLLLFGILEFGGLFRDYLTLSYTLTAAARTEAIFGNSLAADYETMLAIQTAFSATPLHQINYVVVWKAESPDDDVPEECKTIGRKIPNADDTIETPEVGSCNHFSTEQVQNPSESWTCTSSGSPIQHYCPSLRQTALNPSPGPDLLGVYMNITHPWVTGLFGEDITLTDQVVTKLEPQAVYQ